MKNARAAAVVAAVSVALAAVGLVLTLTAPAVPPAEASHPHPSVFLAVLTFTASGFVIGRRRPEHRVGWLFLGEGLAWLVYFVAGAYREHALYGGGAPAGTLVAEAAEWLNLPAITLFPFTFLLFPTGHLPSRRWLPVAIVVVTGMATRFVGEALVADSDDLGRRLVGVGNPMFAFAAFACVVSPIVRYRRAREVERHQLKWFAIAGVGVAAGWTAANIVEATGLSVDTGILRLFSLALLPAAATIAILQYRLYDIDLVISKALVFGALAGFVGLVYVVVVVIVGARLGSTDRPSPALSVAATAITAVAFAPVRHRAERMAARVVYGVRAQPYDVLSSFTAQVSGSIPPYEVLPMLARTACTGTGAASAAVWVRSGDEMRLGAAWPGDGTPAAVAVGDEDDIATLPGDAVFPIRHKGRLLGAISVTASAADRISRQSAQLVEGLASAAALVLENAQLIQELRASRQRLVEAQDSERRRIERNLHDGAQQRLLEVGLTLRMAADAAERGDGREAGACIEQASAQLRESLAELRELARGIHPAILTERGLGAAVESLVDRVPVAVECAVDVSERLPDAVEATVYFTVSEALANVVKHARATRVEVRIVATDGLLRAEIVDDGVGGADARGSGLRGLADRVAALDGALDVTSGDGGTSVVAQLPVQAARQPVS